MPISQPAIIEYDQNYIDACFYAWYKAGRPRFSSSNGSHMLRVIPLTQDGKKPRIQTLKTWIEKFGWEQHADALDAEAGRKLDNDAIKERIRTLREIAKHGEELATKGLEYLRKTENPFADNPSAAVRAIVTGAEMRFKYAGAADVLENITQMSDKQVLMEIQKRLGNENNIIDAESEDIPSDDDDSTEDDE